ncbi:hypothetical protein BH683_016365 [Williamsia sp. 1138]|uniref:hypothetical protein n=1 Tax=Williamsia sp. 1138 TaxID=1903117 RepID=UPI000A0F7970|nr:hypothetical protein [Williamsia sp. 1138]OZG27869.1 hypothetical protein BH683_016365 [Williamsia sp. 1138]
MIFALLEHGVERIQPTAEEATHAAVTLTVRRTRDRMSHSGDIHSNHVRVPGSQQIRGLLGPGQGTRVYNAVKR